MSHKSVAVTLVAALFAIAAAFNVSPVPNVIFSEPALSESREFPKVRSSYFGLAVHLKRDAIFIGAPRAQSVSPRQAKINETGAIFRCGVTNGICSQFMELDDQGESTYEVKSGQFFGATLDGVPDGNELVGCAPRLIHEDKRAGIPGICYAKVNRTTVKLKEGWLNRARHRAFDTSLEGFAVHMLKEASGAVEVVTGLPDYNNTGAIFIYNNQSAAWFVKTLEQETGGYFGYSIASMVVQHKTLYLVSAPRFNGNPGKVFIFEVVQEKYPVMKPHRILESDHIREYFGYSLCTEDINGDGLVDVLIGAPFYSRDSFSDNGAVYVYKNKGFDQEGKLVLDEPLKLESKYSGSSQFGYTIVSIGDINYDGLNDIAIGAPFESNGAVYIFHGNTANISTTPAQILSVPNVNRTLGMFGASIAKAVDVDGNGYGDIAVGAPSEDRVYLFKTYPLVRPIVNVTMSKSFIGTQDTTVIGNETFVIDDFDVVVCYFYETLRSNSWNYEYDFRVNVSIDSRAKFDGNFEFQTITDKIATAPRCTALRAAVRTTFYQVTTPIKLEFTYGIANQTTTNQEFCEQCAIQEPGSYSQTHTIPFGLECDDNQCKVDLKLRSELVNFTSPVTLNATKMLNFMYEITNTGSVAYGTVLQLDFSQNVSFAKFPLECESFARALTCKVNNGRPVRKGKPETLFITVDGTKLGGDRLEIVGQITSDGEEVTVSDNRVVHEIKLARLSKLDVQGTFDPSFFDIGYPQESTTIKAKFVFENLGPSNVGQTLVSMMIPVKFNDRKVSCPLVKSVKSWKVYKQHGNVSTLLAATESPTTSGRRSPIVLRPSNESSHLDQKFLRSKKEVPISCHNPNIICRNISFHLDSLPGGLEELRVDLELDIEPAALLKLMRHDVADEMLSLFVTFSFFNDETLQTYRGSLLFYRSELEAVPLWVYVTSVLFGTLIFAAITRFLHQRQFFKRMTQSEMEEKLDKECDMAYIDGSVMMIGESTVNILQ